MGTSLADIGRGMLDTGKVLVDGMNAWNNMVGKGTSSATPPIASTTVSQPAVSNQTVSNPQTMMGGLGLGAIPPWAWLVGLGLLAWRYR
jgi:hypothetical protein